MEEEFRKVEGFGGQYAVSSDGRVVRRGTALERIRGRYVNLSWHGVVRRMDVSYLVARAWVANPTGKPWVRHKDGDRDNCNAENLEWSETPERKYKKGRAKLRVGQYDENGILLRVYGSLYEAECGSSVARSLIKRCCDGAQGKSHGFIWRYVE